MPDETLTAEEILEDDGGGTAVADPEDDSDESEVKKLTQEVSIDNAGPCRKHIKVSISRADIDDRLNERYSEMVHDAQVPGYRPGKAPRKLIEKRFQKEVSEKLKAELLLASLEQLDEEQNLNAISEPNIDPFKVEFPEDGPLEYEFEVEVAPDFELPDYKGLKIKRPVRESTDELIDQGLKNFLAQYGTLVPKSEPAELDDYIIADITTQTGSTQIGTLKEVSLKVQPQIAFRDGIVEDFGAKIAGAKAGDKRELEIKLSSNVANPGLRNITADLVVAVKDVKSLRLPDLDEDFLEALGLESEDELRDKIRTVLENRLEHEQRESARSQVLQLLAGDQDWDLPRGLLGRQARKALDKRVLELRRAGYSEEEISAQENMLRQDAIANSEQTLKEYFVLQKIADVEKLEVSEDDIEDEIGIIAKQTNESPRRVRAKLEKEDMMDAINGQIIERKALDLVLNSAEYEDVAYEAETATGAVAAQAVPGEEPDFAEEESEDESDEATAEDETKIES